MCRRLDHLERELAFLKGKESQEPIIGQLSREVGDLRALVGDLRTDLKICRKVDGQVLLPVNELAQTYRNEERVISSHPHVIEEIERKRHDCGGDGH